MPQAPALDEPLPFSNSLTVDVRLLLEEARQTCRDKEKTIALLEQAQILAPDQLEVYFRRYKYLFYNKQLHEAELVARQGLDEAARQLGFSPDWMDLFQESADWSDANGAERFYLFTLKALAFIVLRQERVDESQQILDKLNELDPDDQVGGSVIRQMAMSIREQCNAA